MKRILLQIQYDGANFVGWQVQVSGRSVQGEVERSLFELTGEKIAVFGSGRTDAGVSARMQCAHFDTNSKIADEKIALALNTKLPGDISILSSKRVPDGFHARYSVKTKTYEYTLYSSRIKQPLLDRTMTRCTAELNLERMKEEAASFLGKHDFRAFCSAGSAVKSFERTIESFKIIKKGCVYTFTVTGDGFLYNMVRIMVGTLVEAGKGKEIHVSEILKGGNRSLAGRKMPSKGLVLKKVKY